MTDTTATEAEALINQIRTSAAQFAYEQRSDERGSDWNAACDHIANGFIHEANPLGRNVERLATPRVTDEQPPLSDEPDPAFLRAATEAGYVPTAAYVEHHRV